MPKKDFIPAAILEAAVKVLQVAKPELSTAALSAALSAANDARNCEKPAPEKPFSRKQAAAFLGVSLSTLDRMTRSGKLRTVRIGLRSVRIYPESVYTLLGNQ